ncbi:hypothetical protein PFICI_10321 [Pestalotiopsis fici W106-1]|uniref:Heterokaryon incompatibility domain-containing protein n=1 Tax=Pestalotiopsis fici (strain W106-1 / CGMCC3.15140) TaxID=1229662 RepID=W3WWV0_PESFW|nr:uncharacterized protein PFICI_10321 [Pestalotiopsis fici W106-1]ETS78259.1 hypothetical protein PFICI_10321 [Pestalotiopsis fici W106-1]
MKTIIGMSWGIEARRYRQALLASNANTAVSQNYREAPLDPAQRARAYRGDSGSHSRELFTQVGLVEGLDTCRPNVQNPVPLCIFISDGADQHETWTLVRELTVRMMCGDTEAEFTVTCGEEELATVAYNRENLILSRCIGQVGLALELITTMVEYMMYSVFYVEFPELPVGAVAGFLTCDETTRPSGASHWMPRFLLDRLIASISVQDGFVDIRRMGMSSYVRTVRLEDVKLLCPSCWVTSVESAHQGSKEQATVQPRRFVKTPSIATPDEDAAVGGPPKLWIDRVCIDQNDDATKNSEISLMGSYYAGAHTTLICPATEIVDVPSLQPSRHLLAIPDRLRAYQGLLRWKQDPWHKRVWTYQEGAMSKKPRVWVADQGVELNAGWLNFMSWAADCERPVKCDLGLPPYCQKLGEEGIYYPQQSFRESGFLRGEGDAQELWAYRNSFARSWTTCELHDWAPKVDNIKKSLSRLIEITQLRKCTETRDKILGILALALSSEHFRTNMVRDLQDAYREAIRSGIPGAEVLMCGWTASKPRSWIPENNFAERWVRFKVPAPGNSLNVDQPVVDQKGRLILKAYKYDFFKNVRRPITLVPLRPPRQPEFITFEYRTLSGDFCLISLEGYVSHRGRAYVLAGAEGKSDRDLHDHILVFVSEAGGGSHVLEGACRIVSAVRTTSEDPESKEIRLGGITSLALSADSWG